MARTSVTYANILDYVTEFISKEGARPSESFVLLMANQALAEIAEAAGCIRATWTNAAQGDLSITGNSTPIPVDCIVPLSVEWDGSDNPLDRSTVEKWDEDTPGWRDETGDPSEWAVEGANIVLNAQPSNATGKMRLRGLGMLGDLSGTNPLTNLPYPRQLTPAYYVVWRYPVTPKDPTGDGVEAMTFAAQETKRRVQVRDDHRVLWEANRLLCIDWLRARMNQEHEY